MNMRSDFRIICCAACNGEGHTLDGWDFDAPLQCQWCDGTGGEIIRVEPITIEDLQDA